MRAENFLRLCETLPIADGMSSGRGFVVLAPHPDDEALGCAGLIAQAVARGTPVELIVLSDGAGSHPRSPAFSRDRLVSLREAESLACAKALGLGEGQVTFLGRPDGAVTVEPAAVAAIVAKVRAIDAGSIVVTWRHDPHCDHRGAADLADAVHAILPHVTIFAYPIWGWALPPDQEVGGPPAGFRLDITPYRQAKARAIAAHRSQTSDLIDDDPDGFRLTPATLERFAGCYEIFIDTTPAAAP